MNEPVTIVLSAPQIAQVLRGISGGASVTAFLAELDDAQLRRRSVRPLLRDPQLSQSLLRALLVLAEIPAGAEGRDLKDVADELEWTRSTTHRYAATWTELGVLQRDPESRRYSRPATEESMLARARVPERGLR